MREHPVEGNRALEELFQRYEETGISAEEFASLSEEARQQIINAAATYEPKFYTVVPA